MRDKHDYPINPRVHNPCTECKEPGIPGLFKGQGKCQYHWNVSAYGREWADKCREAQKGA
jgi:hypothetical protein